MSSDISNVRIYNTKPIQTLISMIINGILLNKKCKLRTNV